MKHPPIPIRAAAHSGRRPDLEIAAHAAGVDDPSVVGLGHVEAALSVALLVIVAVREQRAKPQGQRRAGQQPVTDHGAVHAMFQPDALFDDATIDGPAKDWEHAVDLDLSQPPKAIRIDRAIPVLLRRERLGIDAGRQQPFLQPREQHDSLYRQVE